MKSIINHGYNMTKIIISHVKCQYFDNWGMQSVLIISTLNEEVKEIKFRNMIPYQSLN